LKYDTIGTQTRFNKC